MSFDFEGWLRAGIAAGLSPAQVWATSLRDLRALAPAPQVPSRSDFAALCARFPDDDGDEHG